MLELLLIGSAIVQPAAADAALARCRPALERKAGGQINAIRVDAARVTGRWTVIRGSLTAFVGMGPPAPGSASTHHLIRAEYQYVCWVRGSRVWKTTLSQP